MIKFPFNAEKSGQYIMSSQIDLSENSHTRKAARRMTSLLSVVSLSLATTLQPLAVSSASAQSVNRNYVVLTEQHASQAKSINLGLDKSIVIDLPSVANDVLVANPEVADAVMRTSKRIYLFGKKVGQTNIFVFDGSGKQIAAIDVNIERDIAGLEDSISRLIPDSTVRAEMINDNVVLTGTVKTPADAARAIQLAEIFANGGENTGPQGFAALFGGGNESTTINLLKIEGQDQVQLRVQVIEIQRQVLKQLGFSTGLTGGSDGFLFSGLAQQGLQQSISGSPLAAASYIGEQVGLTSTIRAMETAGVTRTLAEPNLTAVSGEPATFKVGGKYQHPTQIEEQLSQGIDGSIGENPDRQYRVGNTARGSAVEYEETEYGISLAFTPTVLTEGRISLKLALEVSEPSPVGASSAFPAGALYGTRQRQTSTTVELPSGGSMAIAGLVQDDIQQAVAGIPGLSRLPVLGTLFRSREFRRLETELVVIITPYLVRPTARRNLKTPDQNFQPSSEGAGMFMGRVNRVYGTKQGKLPKGRYTGAIGFIYK